MGSYYKPRAKGQAGEKEFAKILGELLNLNIKRNLSQTREGGYDLTGCDDFCIEVKRGEKLEINKWWDQARQQAEKNAGMPVLAYRQNRHPWRIIVPMKYLVDGFETKPMDLDYCMTLSPVGFSEFVKIYKGY